MRAWRVGSGDVKSLGGRARGAVIMVVQSYGEKYSGTKLLE